MDIFLELKKLNFPPDKYLVIGGAALAGRNLKQTRDLDILVEKNFLEELRKDSHWKYHPRIIPTEKAGLVNEEGTVELYPTVGKIDLEFEDMKTREETIEGVPFANLQDILLIKKLIEEKKT
jgi:hypothetical protein